MKVTADRPEGTRLPMKKIILICLKASLAAVCGFLVIPQAAEAGIIIIPSQDEVKIPIEKGTGSLVQLPFSVKTITPSEHFEITDVAPDVDAATGGKVDVRLFLVKPLASSRSERVTFVLGNGKSVAARFVAADEADKHYDLVFPSDTKKRKDPRFLQSEIALMRSMKRDEAGDFARQITDESVKLTNIEGVSATLTRVFASQGLVGYVFELRNKASETVRIAIPSLSLGNPNRAVLLAVDKDVLEACGFISASPACKTRLLVVARGESNESRGLSTTPGSTMPFVRQSPQGGAQ